MPRHPPLRRVWGLLPLPAVGGWVAVLMALFAGALVAGVAARRRIRVDA